jgi:thymidylate synthase
MEYIDDYFVNYLMNPELAENETYTYASRIQHCMPKGGTQLERVVEMLKETPLTNQAVIEVGAPDDIDVCYGKDGKLDPPCLRLIDFKVIPSDNDLALTVTVYFRSWDLWAGFPTNLGGIELLKQYVASEANLKNGPMYAYSAGAHIYGYQEEIARLRTLKTKLTGHKGFIDLRGYIYRFSRDFRCLLYREAYKKRCSLPRFTFDTNSPFMVLYYFRGKSKSKAGTINL